MAEAALLTCTSDLRPPSPSASPVSAEEDYQPASVAQPTCDSQQTKIASNSLHQIRRFTRLKRPSEGNSDSDDNLFVPTSATDTMRAKSPSKPTANGSGGGGGGGHSFNSSVFETVSLNSVSEEKAGDDVQSGGGGGGCDMGTNGVNNGSPLFKYNSSAWSSMAYKFQCDSNGHSAPESPCSQPEVDQMRKISSDYENDMFETRARTSSIVDGLLYEIYDKLNFGQRGSADSDTYTEYSTLSDGRFGDGGGGSSAGSFRRRSSSGGAGSTKGRRSGRLQRNVLEEKGVSELRTLLRRLQINVNQVAAELVQQLKRRDRLLTRRDRNYDVITAVLQAASLKRRVDTRMRFSVEPFVGDSGFAQWHDAMRMVARLPGGIPWEFRKRLWLTMADKHIQHRKVDWERVKRFCFNDRSNPDDNELGVQIVKDLHRTGCSLFCGEDAEHNQALLKRVLLAYARWNKTVGYCQGFNMLAALILEVMEWKEEDALKVMIYLIEGVLPESYFANNLRGLSVDMAVFRDLLRMRLSSLSRHLDHLQLEARDSVSGTSYEPPLTNVFTMQWFLTLFSNCLPKKTVLRVWDLIFLEGNEVLLRTALTIWDGLADRIMAVDSADEFYSIMGVLTREMLEFGLMDANHLVKTICTMAPFPFPQLGELRDKYTYNITPFTAAAVGVAKRGLRLFYSDDEEEQNEDEQLAVAAWCFASVFPPQLSPIKGKGEVSGNGSGGRSPSPSPNSNGTNFTSIGPGAFGSSTVHFPDPNVGRQPADADRMSLDISALKKQYAKLRERQKQAHVILAAASSRQYAAAAAASSGLGPKRPTIAVNHLLIGKKPLISRRNSQGSMQGLIRFQFKNSSKPIVTSHKDSKNNSSSKESTSKGSKKSSGSLDKTVPAGGRTASSHPHSKERIKTAISTQESGETLHWKDAKRRIMSESDVTKHVKPVKKEKSPKRDKENDQENAETSSTSTELCDEDVARVSDLDSDLEDRGDAEGEKEDISHGSSSTTATESTERMATPRNGKQLPSLSESSDGEVTSLRSEATAPTIPSVVVSPGEWPQFMSSESLNANGSKTPSPSKELSESDAESETGLNVSKWIESFDRGLLDSDDYQVLEMEGGEGPIVEVSKVAARQISTDDDDDDYSAEKRGEWLAKLEMYRRTLGVDTMVADSQRTSSDEYHSLSDGTATCDDEDDNNVQQLRRHSTTNERPILLNILHKEDQKDDEEEKNRELAEIEPPQLSPSPSSSTEQVNVGLRSHSPYADNEKVKRYFDQGSPIRNVPTAYVPGRLSSIYTDMEGLERSSETDRVLQATLPPKTTPTPTSPTKSAIFNPFPTARKSQLWGNNEIGVKLGLYGTPSKPIGTTTNKKQLGQR